MTQSLLQRSKVCSFAQLALAITVLTVPGNLFAQRSRISGRINPRQWAPLSGNVHPNARAEFDQGKTADTLELSSVTLVLKPSATQQANLEQLLADQQNPGSASYHKWISPAEYADRFGASQSDIDKILDWAQSAQLTVSRVAAARNAVTLQGSAAQFGSALHTEFHRYQVNGKAHFANATEPSVPAAIQDMVQAIHGLDNFRMKPRAHRLHALGTAADGLTPSYTSTTTGNHYLGPDDFKTIFNLGPLYAAGIDGTGHKIVVVGQSQILASSQSSFSTYFGLAAPNLTMTLVPNTKDPGVVTDDQQESDLDVQWVSAVARGAAVQFVYSYDVMDAVYYAIDQNLAPVISMSYGLCETASGKASANTMRTYAQQAAAQGITWVASSGDSGAAGCYSSGSNSSLALSADLPASVPEVTAVGGTTFSEGSGTYWDTTNSATKSSALSYIPETSWNDSAANGSPSSSGGGVSRYFAKPSWQTGTGVPADGSRDVPDVAFPASANHVGYMVYTTESGKSGWYIFGGTSCGTPAFAGVLVLLNHYLVANSFQAGDGLGNVNSHLYSYAASYPGAFHDITTGNNIVTASGTRGTTATSSGYSAGAGYDLVTGLGSVDAYRFVAGWKTGGIPKSTPSIALAATPDSLATGGTVTLTATVSSNDGTTPTGSVTFSSASSTLGVANLTGAGGSATASLTVSGSAAGLGATTVTAVYNGDSEHNAATTVTTLTVVSAAAPPVITATANSASYQLAYAPGMLMSIFGSSLALSTRAASSAPLPTSMDNVMVTVNGVPAPLFYVSPTQLNVQIPYETADSGSAVVIVSNNGQTSATSISMHAAAPGIFMDAGSALVPVAAAAPGQVLTAYVTGVGAVSPFVSTGATPTAGAAPAPTGTVLVTVGGVAAATSYVGVPGWSVGVLQINFTVPASVAVGTQPVVVSVGGLSSAGVTINVAN